MANQLKVNNVTVVKLDLPARDCFALSIQPVLDGLDVGKAVEDDLGRGDNKG